MTRPKQQTASVRFDYHSVYNEIVNPKHFVSLTLYYITHWAAKLGPNGHMIVSVLRSHGFYDNVNGKHREAVDVDQKTLAGECGMSLSTFQREFARNALLAKFVQREFVAVRDKTGRILREHYVYRVKMDDPLTPEDEARFAAMIEGPDKPTRQIDIPESEPTRQNDASGNQNDVPTRQNATPTRQNDALYKESLTTPNTETTLDTPAAHGVLPSASGEKQESSLSAARRNRADDFAFIDKLRKTRQAAEERLGKE